MNHIFGVDAGSALPAAGIHNGSGRAGGAKGRFEAMTAYIVELGAGDQQLPRAQRTRPFAACAHFVNRDALQA